MGVVILAMLMQPFLQTHVAEAGTISGYVMRADTNQPLSGAEVFLSSSDTLRPVAGAVADGVGRFAISKIPNGRYRLIVRHRGFVTYVLGQTKPAGYSGTTFDIPGDGRLREIVIRMTPTATVTGRVIQSDGQPAVDAIVYAARVRYDITGTKKIDIVKSTTTNDMGEYRLFWLRPDRYFICTKGPVAPVGMTRDAAALLPQPHFEERCYPSMDETSTGPLDLTAGSLLNMDLDLLGAITQHAIRGRVEFPSDVRVNPAIHLYRVDARGNALGDARSVTANADRSFEIANVGPGTYIAVASISAGSVHFKGQTTLVMVNRDLDDVILPLNSAFTIKGQVRFDEIDDVQSQLALFQKSRIRILLQAADAVTAPLPLPPPIDASGSFSLENVAPGKYQLAVTGLPADAFIRAASIGREDVLEDDLVLSVPPDSTLEIVLGLHGGRIDGSVSDGEQPAKKASVVLIPNDRTRTYRYKVIHSDDNGNFSIRGVVPGQYQIFAIDELTDYEYRDPSLVQRFEAMFRTLEIKERSQETVSIPLAKTRR